MLQSLIWVKCDRKYDIFWHLSPQGCLLLYNKDLNHNQHTWGKSNEFCTELGNNTRLVEVYTPEQRDALTLILSKKFIDDIDPWKFILLFFPVDHNGLYYWVGATDQRHEGTWLWGSGEQVQDFVWMKSNFLKKENDKSIHLNIF